jgi:hypothetical protein
MMNPLVEGEDFYYDAEGLLVFTEKFLGQRGYCCGYGCRHCPYDYERVPEPRREELRAKRGRDNRKS